MNTWKYARQSQYQLNLTTTKQKQRQKISNSRLLKKNQQYVNLFVLASLTITLINCQGVSINYHV
jgi:hypothetical protein